MAILDGSVFKRIERYFYLHDKIARAVREAREQMLYGHAGTEKTGGVGHCYISDPTANKAIGLVDPIQRVEVDGETIRRPEDWLKVVAATRQRFAGTPMGELMERRYIRNETIVKTCQEMHIDRSTYYYWREDIITYAAMVCCQVGLLKVSE
ncbi:prophage LambdaCh01, phage transcriptional regulator, RinA family [Thermosinus carboxydivorans Nor1]|uniref:Prophage LambdaCh01, phage transcriptional regulator, RinA family n=1 Tax=Thermosinus carboxydivorans Nor1 TaxID=401526 RepID=A1HR45_9FIRM|nr:hypothetical protein [Thermosinus carboxydivorans]EAX47544.1 prophage LambdaCh01, phage transcriptional regulator, RinA family [Thermosinus carboxydivorans Nor1]